MKNDTNYSTVGMMKIEGLHERTEYIDISFYAHHSIVFCLQCSVYWWKGNVRL